MRQVNGSAALCAVIMAASALGARPVALAEGPSEAAGIRILRKPHICAMVPHTLTQRS